jgi:hypothetical protein
MIERTEYNAGGTVQVGSFEQVNLAQGLAQDVPNQTKKYDIEISVITTAVTEQILGICIVALILTILELYSLLYVVFPQTKSKISKMIESNRSDSDETKFIKPLLQTLATRERSFTEKANEYIHIVAWCFAGLIFMICLLLTFLISNEYRLRGQYASSWLFLNIIWWSLITVIGIGIFQGFGCIAVGMDSEFCSSNSFAVISTEWKQNDNFAQIALSSGICDNIGDAKSFTTEDNVPLMKTLTSHMAQKLLAENMSERNRTRLSEGIRELVMESDGM